MMPTTPPAGWYSDPDGSGLCWWDGAVWTEHVQPPALPDPVVTSAPTHSVWARIGTALVIVFFTLVIAKLLGPIFFYPAAAAGIYFAIAASKRLRGIAPTPLSPEARALRLILIVLVGAALTFGAVELKDSVDSSGQGREAWTAPTNTAKEDQEKLEYNECLAYSRC